MRARVLLVLLSLFTSLSFGQSSGGAFRISGTVVNAISGEPLGGTRLVLAPTEGARWVKALLTKKDGRFAFDRLGPGKYQLYAERAGYPRQGFDEHPGGFLSAIVTGAGVDSEKLLFRMKPGAAIAGFVRDEYDEAVRGAQVSLFHREVQNGRLGIYIVGQDQTDDRGLYRFAPLMAGSYYVAVSAQPWYAQNLGQGRRGFRESQGGSDERNELSVTYPLTIYPDATDTSEASPINLRTGESYQAEFALRTVPAVHLRLTGGSPEGRGSSVSLTQRLFEETEYSVSSMQEFQTKDGRTVTGFPPGRYLLHFQRSEKSNSELSQWVDLYGDTTIDIDSISGPATASITGLASAQGVKLKNAFVRFRNRDTDQVEGGRIGEDGKFEIAQIAAGTYEVAVANSDSVYLANMAASNAKTNGRTLEIVPGADVRMAIILSKGVGEIRGTAIHGEKGISGVLVLLVPDDPQRREALFRRDQSDSDGTFSLRQVVPGGYTLLAIDNGWDLEWTDAKVLKAYLAKGSRLQVEPSGKYDLKVEVQQAK